MKKIKLAAVILSLSFTANAMASSKVCFGSKNNDDTRGIVMTAQISAQQVSLNSLKSDFYHGTYPTYRTKVKGRDGKVYLEYKGENSDYQDVIMIDQELLRNGTTGLLQIRARGEGFFNSVFVCKDAR